jgi:hypothetical protein
VFFTSSLRDVLAPEKHLELTIALAAELAQCFGYEGAMTRPQVQVRRMLMTDSEKLTSRHCNSKHSEQTFTGDSGSNDWVQPDLVRISGSPTTGGDVRECQPITKRA